jgi:hypothetical protein
MSSNPDHELDQFAIRFLENRGAVLERNKDGFEALLPGELSQLIETPDHIRIENGLDSEVVGVYSMSYGSPLLEKMVDAACARVPILSCELEFGYLKSQGFDRLISEQFQFFNSVGKVESSAAIRTDYILLSCRYLAQSDEQKQGLLQLVFDCETGASIPGMAKMISSVPRDFRPPSKSFWKKYMLKRIMDGIEDQSREILAEEVRSFEQSMNRRFRRDVINLEEYYDALKREMEKSIERPGLSQEVIRDRKTKIGLLPDELARKRDDLFKKYSIRIKVEPCAAMFIRTPAVRVIYGVSVGKNKRNLSLTYNPVTRSMDPMVCQGCGKSTLRAHFCARLHLLCVRCNKKCPICQP